MKRRHFLAGSAVAVTGLHTMLYRRRSLRGEEAASSPIAPCVSIRITHDTSRRRQAGRLCNWFSHVGQSSGHGPGRSTAGI